MDVKRTLCSATCLNSRKYLRDFGAVLTRFKGSDLRGSGAVTYAISGHEFVFEFEFDFA